MRSSSTIIGHSLVVRFAFLASVGLAACSSSSSGGNADAFVGMWTFDSGTLTPMSCSLFGQSVSPIDLAGGMLDITKVDTGHISSAYGSGCIIKLKTDGNSASADSGQNCDVSVSGFAITVSISQWALMLSGNSMTTQMAGSVSTIPGCSVSGSGTLSRPALVDGASGQ